MNKVLNTLSTKNYIHKLNYTNIYDIALKERDYEMVELILKECNPRVDIKKLIITRNINLIKIFCSKRYKNYKNVLDFIIFNCKYTNLRVDAIICVMLCEMEYFSKYIKHLGIYKSYYFNMTILFENAKKYIYKNNTLTELLNYIGNYWEHKDYNILKTTIEYLNERPIKALYYFIMNNINYYEFKENNILLTQNEFYNDYLQFKENKRYYDFLLS